MEQAEVASEVRGIDRDKVTAWLVEHVTGATAPFRFEPLVGGRSNLTYCVTGADASRYVLRRPPLGAVLATAHDMAREHRIISGIGKTSVPVPPALGLCEDTSINGAPFYVMGFVEGYVLVSALDTRRVLSDSATRRAVTEELVEALAVLHTTPPESVGLGDLGRREGYVDRQLRRWRGQWEKSKTRELAEFEETYALLVAAKPEQRFTGIVHGDYRLGNMLVRSDGSLAAVLDWELCTLGDTLADVGYLLNNWAPSDEPGSDLMATGAGGFPSRDEILSMYSQRTGHEVGHIEYYQSFQKWRLAAIVEGVASRYQKGVMAEESVSIRDFQLRVERLTQEALALARSLG